jgi:hypothetical protein
MGSTIQSQFTIVCTARVAMRSCIRGLAYGDLNRANPYGDFSLKISREQPSNCGTNFNKFSSSRSFVSGGSPPIMTVHIEFAMTALSRTTAISSQRVSFTLKQRACSKYLFPTTLYHYFCLKI